MDELFALHSFVETWSEVNPTALVLVHVINESRASGIGFAETQAVQGEGVGTQVVPVDRRGGGQGVVADDLLKVRVIKGTVEEATSCN